MLIAYSRKNISLSDKNAPTKIGLLLLQISVHLKIQPMRSIIPREIGAQQKATLFISKILPMQSLLSGVITLRHCPITSHYCRESSEFIAH